MAVSLLAKINLTRNAETDAERETLRQLKIALNRLGWYAPDPTRGMDDDIDDTFKDAVYTYQRKSTIFFDDTALGPGSTTERTLNRDLAAVDDSALYIWRTVGDEKVRGEHAGRNGQRFSWDNPPDGENPGEDYNCRCWAEPVAPPPHPWVAWAGERRERRLAQKATREKLAPPKELKTGISDLQTPVDAINPTVSPLDFIGWSAVPAIKTVGGEVVARLAARQLAREAAKRDVEWIKNSPISQFQSKFKHAKIFGIKGNPNKQNLEAYKKAIEQHVKSTDTVLKKGTYHKEPVIHYYNEKTGINVIRGRNGDFLSGWKLEGKQIDYIEKTGNLGGSK